MFPFTSLSDSLETPEAAESAGQIGATFFIFRTKGGGSLRNEIRESIADNKEGRKDG